MKRILSALFSVFFLLTLAACTITSAPTDSVSVQPKQTDSAKTDASLKTETSVKTDSETTETSSVSSKTTESERETFSDRLTGRPLLYDDDPQAVEPVLVFDHYDNILYVMDVNKTDWTKKDAVLWKWNLRKSNGRYTDSASTCVDHKYRIDKNGNEVIVTGGHAYVCLIEYPSGKVLWDFAAPGANIHSMEYLPNGNIAAANSGDGKTGWLRIYAATQGNEPNLYYAEYDFPSCHAVLWDPKNECLWALGGSKLIQFAVAGTDAKPKLVTMASYTLPGGGGHDMAAVYGDSDLLWLTGSKNFLFNKETGTFYENFTGSNLIKKGLKGIGNFADCSKLLFVYPNGTDGDFHSDRIYVMEWNKNKIGELSIKTTQRISNFAFYKLRIFNSDYQ